MDDRITLEDWLNKIHNEMQLEIAARGQQITLNFVVVSIFISIVVGLLGSLNYSFKDFIFLISFLLTGMYFLIRSTIKEKQRKIDKLLEIEEKIMTGKIKTCEDVQKVFNDEYRILPEIERTQKIERKNINYSNKHILINDGWIKVIPKTYNFVKKVRIFSFFVVFCFIVFEIVLITNSHTEGILKIIVNVFIGILAFLIFSVTLFICKLNKTKKRLWKLQLKILKGFLFSTKRKLEKEFQKEMVSRKLCSVFNSEKYPLSNEAKVEYVDNGKWNIKDRNEEYIVRKENRKLNIYLKDFVVDENEIIDEYISIIEKSNIN